MPDLQNNRKLRIAATLLALLAVTGAAYSVWRSVSAPRGSDRDAVALICTS
jgi:hypothetical protein